MTAGCAAKTSATVGWNGANPLILKRSRAAAESEVSKILNKALKMLEFICCFSPIEPAAVCPLSIERDTQRLCGRQGG